jgi:uncharacterized protein
MGSAHHPARNAGLFGQTRGALLGLLYGHVDRSFYLRQLAREVGAGHGAVQREVKYLTDLGLLVRRSQGNQILYQANSESPIFPEIRSLIAKTVGVHDILRSALEPLGSKIQVAFVYGSVARQMERTNSDVDLMVLGKASFSDIVSALGPAQKTLAREINPTVYPTAEFCSKWKAGNHFLHSVMADKKLFIIGSERDLAKLASK